MGVQRERVLGGAVALVGVLLALPSAVAPTWHLTISAHERGELLSEQWEWSWGRSRLVGSAGVELQDLWNPLGLTIFVVLLVAACAAATVWVLDGSSWAALVGPVAVAGLAGRLVSSSAERHGGTFREGIYGLTTVTDRPTAAVLESTASIVLLVALAVMAFTLVRGDLLGGGPPWGRAGTTGAAARHTSADARCGAGGAVGPEVIERPSVTASLRPEGEHLSAAPVVFGDVAEEEQRR